RPLIDLQGRDPERVHVELLVLGGLLCIGHRAAKQLRHRLGGALLDIGELRQRLVDVLAADQIGHHAHLARGDAEIAKPGGGFHRHPPLAGAAGAAGAGAPGVAGAAGAPGAPGRAVPGLTFLSPVWPWKVRVGANSPSLWPTMFSVTNTGMNLRPLCTANVCPTRSGRIVLRRDQVLTTFFWFCRFMSSTFLIRWRDRKS